jgi:hypothetical protein
VAPRRWPRAGGPAPVAPRRWYVRRR